MGKTFHINWNSLRVRIMTTICIGMVLMLSIMLALYLYTNNMINRRMEMHLESTSNIANQFLSYRLEKSKGIASIIANNANLEKVKRNYLIADRLGSGYTDAVLALARDIMYHAEIDMEVDSIFLHLEAEEIFIDSNRNVYEKEELDQITWLKSDSFTKNVTWIQFHDDVIAQKNIVSLVFRADQYSIRLHGPMYVYINFSTTEFYELLKNITLTERGQSALINFDDSVMILDADAMGRAQIKLQTLRQNIDFLRHGGEIWMESSEHGPSVLRYSELDQINGGVLHIIPRSDLRPYSQELFIIILVSIILLIIVYLVLLYAVILRFVDKPLKELVGHMKKVEKGEFNHRIIKKRKDEFGVVHDAYNEMVQKVETLIHELYQEKLVKREMELKVLQEKINPHFLYNTLDTINWIAKENEIEEISELVIALSTMYRKTFNKGRDLISIENVLVSVRCYLDIQQIRYGDSFRYKLKADPAIMNLQILNLVVQTIVENAIVHGFAGMKDDGLLRLEISQIEDDLKIMIEDNGKGMSSEKLELIRAVMNAEIHENDSGLRNVQKRIKLYYGERYGLTIKSEEGKGTKVTIVIPVLIEDTEGYEDY